MLFQDAPATSESIPPLERTLSSNIWTIIIGEREESDISSSCESV